MSKIKWDQVGERKYETGVDHGVLYLPNPQGVYATGVAWNGLTMVGETPTGGEATPFYADNIKYLNLVSREEFEASLEAMTYPKEFEVCEGSASPVPGVTIGQQSRRTFGLSYRTLIGNDVTADLGYKIHLIYGALATPTEKSYNTINDTPEPIMFSWSMTTTPVEVPNFKPTASLVIDSTTVTAAKLAAFEEILYGRDDRAAETGPPAVTAQAALVPRLPLPAEVFTLLAAV